MRLHFQCLGEGAPLIILHGLLGSLDNWQSVSRKLGERHRVCALDLRNHGRSPHSETFDYEVMAADVSEFMAAQQMERAVVMGHSMGGKVAMRLALAQPEKVEKLVVVDMAPRAYEPAHIPIFEAMQSLDLNSFRERSEMDAALAPRIPEAAVRQFLLKNVARDEQGAFRWKPNLPAIRRNYDKITAAIQGSGQFDKPGLFIQGGKSSYITEADHATIKSMFPMATMAIIPEAGHWVHAEAPGKLIELVSNFIG